MNTANLESQLYTIDMFLATGKRPTDGQIDQMIWALPEDKRAFFIKRVNEKLLEAGFEIRYASSESSSHQQSLRDNGATDLTTITEGCASPTHTANTHWRMSND